MTIPIWTVLIGQHIRCHCSENAWTRRRTHLRKDQLFSGKGSALQYQDSQIAEYVLKDMQARGQPVLPVHDSFIVQDKYLAHLYSSMNEAYRMLGVDSIPEVKIKAGANTTYDKPYFMELWQGMDAVSKKNKKELEGIKELEDLV